MYVTTVQIQNPSTRDLQNVVLNFEVDERSVILHSIARVLGSIPELSFTQQFSDGAKAALNHDMPNPVDVVYYDRHRDYLVPVFNRGAVVHAGFLISRDDGSQPFIVTTCDHSGVKLVFRALAQSTLGVSNRQAQVIGLIASLGLTIVVAYVTPNIWTGSVFGWISGLFALLIGAVLIRFGRLMMGLFG
ncbi:MAG TPA: hypothetical protein VFQ76_13590 [Longimicrobiaceae bacterium]|nr:hypothetical protein [Longimicrobiaceae bacterium]